MIPRARVRTFDPWPAVRLAAAGFLLLCAGGAAQSQDPFSGPDVVTATENQKGAPRGEVGKQQDVDEIQAKYRQILSAWAGGQTERAAAELMTLEGSVVADGDLAARKRLLKAQEAVIHGIGATDLETLVPVAMLHHEVYRRYLILGAKGRSLLLGHARGMTRDLAILYREQSGSQGAALVSSRILTSLGGHLQKHAQQLPAAEMFSQAIQMDPRNTAALLGLAIVYEKNSQAESAVNTLRKLLEADPAHAEARLRLALNLERLEKGKEAQKILEELASSNDSTWVTALAIQELARRLSQSNASSAAQKVLEEGIERFPNDARLYIQLAHVLDRRGEIRPAQAIMEKVLVVQTADSPAASARMLYNTTRDETFEAARKFLDENARSRLSLLAQALGVPNRANAAAVAAGAGS
ncbi:MAG TPA: tetratricopeptide repeat protein [Thermoanaerobaculia bacterium]